MNTHMHTQAHLCVTRARGSCPASFESALRGLAWAATCFSRARSDQTEQRLLLRHSCSSLPSASSHPPFLTSALCSFRGKHMETYMHSCAFGKPYVRWIKSYRRASLMGLHIKSVFWIWWKWMAVRSTTRFTQRPLLHNLSTSSLCCYTSTSEAKQLAYIHHE